MENASEIEIWWTIAWVIALLASLWTGVRRAWRAIAVLRDEHDAANVWLFVQRTGTSIVFIGMSAIFAAAGWAAMNRVRPVLEVTRESDDTMAMWFVLVAVAVAVFQILLMVSDPLIDRAMKAQSVKAAEVVEEARVISHAEGVAEAEAGAEQRHLDRDAGRDEGRDPIRDLARDDARDAEVARDAEIAKEGA